MLYLTKLNFDLPLSNPVIIFSLVLFIILFAPILFNKIKVPHIIGLILAGVIIGPYGLNFLRRDSSIVLFGTVGLLYIMFLAGLEIDLTEFKKSRNKILSFGLLTFLLPLIFGTLASHYVLGYSFMSSVLLASMFSTHTLVSYPITSRYGINKKSPVALTVGGTMITDILALLILAAVAGMAKEQTSSGFWFQLGISSVVFVCIVFFLLPPVIRWFFKHFDDSVSQYIFVLAIVFLSSFLAEAAGVEAIIGAFFSGLVLNRFVPHSSPLMNRIDFVGNALFIPFFLISVGMLVDLSVLIQGWGALKVAGVIVVVAVATKYLAAFITRKSFRLSRDEGNLIFGLSTSHAAATLAIILVGYNIIIGETPNGEPIRLLNEDVLNGTILLILVSCGLSSFVVERAARKLALAEEKQSGAMKPALGAVLISLARPEAVAEIVDFGLMLAPKKSHIPVFALHVISDSDDAGTAAITGKKMMERASRQAVAGDHEITPLTRHDAHISNGIIYTIREKNITELVMGLHRQASAKEYLGPTTERIIKSVHEAIFLYKPVQPINTNNRMVVLVTPHAELEPGFAEWNTKLQTLAKEAGMNMNFYAHADTLRAIKSLHNASQQALNISYQAFDNWEDFLYFSGVLRKNDVFTIIASREGNVSYNPTLKKLPYYLANYFAQTSIILIYPKQLERGIKMSKVQHAEGALSEAWQDRSIVLAPFRALWKRLMN
ncbi:MAG: cation:proton antiporter [Bacteroidetes bacterium]|nr:cation:proton antiporter [Bacteroidota bacterium]